MLWIYALIFSSFLVLYGFLVISALSVYTYTTKHKYKVWLAPPYFRCSFQIVSYNSIKVDNQLIYLRLIFHFWASYLDYQVMPWESMEDLGF